MAAVADCANDAVGKLQHDNCVVDIACRGNTGIAYGARLSKDLLYLGSNQETGHIEIMDCHIEEDTTGDANIVDWWGSRITADDMDEQRLADFSFFHGLSHAAKIGIKAPVEANLQFDTSPSHDSQGLIN